MSIDADRDAFVERLFVASLGMGEAITVCLGDSLGLYRILADEGPLAAADLATHAGIVERYAREWLEQQAAAAILEVDDPGAAPEARRYALPDAHREPLLDRDSPYSMVPMARSLMLTARAVPALVEAFRTGGGVPGDAYGPEATQAQGDFNRPWLLASLGTEHVPSISDVHVRLLADPPARVADIACGAGWAAISLARAYPTITVDGFDLDDLAIEMANANARDAGVADRVRFEARDAADPSLQGTYDFAIVVEAIHDMSDPVGVLRSIRKMLVPGGSLLVADERVEHAFTAPANELERLFYVYSVLACLPGSMTEQPSAATGTVMRPATFERYAREAGFDEVEILPIEHDAMRFYRMVR